MRILLIFLLISILGNAQVPEDIKLNSAKIQMFEPYIAFKHTDFKTWKENNKLIYWKELWYYTESFYVKRNYLKDGEVLNESIVDISRFEYLRKESEESIVELTGFKDVIVLIPNNKLIYKP